MIPYAKHSVTDADIENVIEVLRGDYLTQGSWVKEFENEFSSYTGANYAVAVNSGTAALHLSCLSLGLSNGDILWTSPISFVASANCALYCQANIDFVDINIETGLMSTTALEKKLKQAESIGKLPKIVVLVHYAGQCCDMEVIANLSKRYGFAIIEDGCHALGGTYKKIPVGSSCFSDCTTFSFHPAKNITTGEGGMITTNNEELYRALLNLRTHGIIRGPLTDSNGKFDPWYYEQIRLGFNYRMPDILAALGVSQLSRLDTAVSKRHRLVNQYENAVGSMPISVLSPAKDSYSGCHIFVVRLNDELDGICRRDDVLQKLRSSGIAATFHFIPIHTQPYYRAIGFNPGDFPSALKFASGAITLPLYPSLVGSDIDYIVSMLEKSFVELI
jgi:UDP-4-amino-4,6-dideoxy-N-acetyl-beta-L-altrosamine transaminase